DEVITNEMPDLGLPIKDFQHNTWHVTNWNNLERMLTGPEFEVGGWKWRILLFPFGNKNISKVSIYLDFADLQGAHDGWHCCVQFVLILSNPEDPTQYVSHCAFHRFTAENSDWGFGSFYDQRKLFIPSSGRTRPLIENNSCNITTLVRVLEDSTGTLWSDVRSFSTGYIGLNNDGINTFLNSAIQSLYFIKYLRKAVYQIPIEKDKSSGSISSALQRIFYQLNSLDSPVDITELTKFFGWNLFFMTDVREFIRAIQDDIRDKIKNTKVDDPISKLFMGTMKSYIKCVNVNYESLHIENYYDIQLSVKGCKTLDESLMKYTHEDILDKDNKYNAEGYGLQVAKKSVIFESFPPVLHIYLDRFDYDVKSNLMLNNRFEFPLEIDLQKYLSPDADKSKSHKYLLHGVLIRDNAIDGEDHHFAFLKPEKNHGWVKFDDDKVTSVSVKEMLDISYGAEDNKFKDAYMLVYIRESDIDEILYPILPKDVKQSRYLLEEFEQARKELGESCLYLKTWTFKKHNGFDLTNFNNQQHPLSEIPQFKILRDDTFITFKKKVAKKFKLPVDKIRFWFSATRQNKTIRPYELITDDYLTETMETIKTTMGYNELKLYMEIFEKPINNMSSHDSETSPIIIFLKYFDPDIQSLDRSLGQLYVQEESNVGEIFPILCKKKQFPPNTPINVYEIKPDRIDKMYPENTFKISEIINGDIICFQKELTDKEIQEHVSAGRLHSIPQFYDALSKNVVVQFRSKFGYKSFIPEFSLILNKSMTYEVVINQVSTYLNIDPSCLLLTSIYFDNIDKMTLSEMLQFSSNLYYE
ncbi:3308_t:CDS:10, partial [Scutellospora calospora]